MAASGDSFKAWLPVAVLALGPILMVIFIAMAFTQTGPNPRGAQAAQSINVAPDSPDRPLLNTLDRSTDPLHYLSLNSQQLSAIKAAIDNQNRELKEGSAYKTIPAERVSKIKALLTLMSADISNLEIAISSKATQNAQKYTADYITNLAKVDLLSMGDSSKITQTAVQLIETNKDGTGPIKYARIRPVVDGTAGYPDSLDSSGFVSYVLQKTGIFRPNEAPDVSTFATTLTTDARFQVIISTPGVRVPDDQVKSLLKPGDIILSSTGSIAAPNDATSNINHVALYIGSGHPGDLAQSTVTKTKVGPQYGALADRLANSGTIQAILRVRSDL